MTVRPSSMQSRTRRGISASESGANTRKGSSTRQSVASVTCVTRAYASKRMLSSRVCLTSALRRREQLGDFLSAHRIRRIAALLHLMQPVVQGLDELLATLRVVQQIIL